MPSRPRVPTLREAKSTVRAALEGGKCDADAVLAATVVLEGSAAGREVRPGDLDITDESLPDCDDDHLPDDAPTSVAEAEAEPDPPDGTECDASRGGHLSLCLNGPPSGGKGTNCVMIGEYTGPPRQPKR